MEKLYLNLGEGITEIGENTLLIFLDETGVESLNDPNAPFFGFGGLVVECRHYFEKVEYPWYKIKDEHWNGRHSSMHASDLKKPPEVLIGALNNFFDQEEIGRIAVTITDKSINNTDHNIENIVFGCIWDRIIEVSNKMKWFDIVILIEENERLKNAFETEIMSKTPRNKYNKEVPVRYGTILKDPAFAGLEVADFIIHTAGRQARVMRGNLFNKTGKIDSQPDFEHVFGKIDKKSWLNLSRISSKNGSV